MIGLGSNKKESAICGWNFWSREGIVQTSLMVFCSFPSSSLSLSLSTRRVQSALGQMAELTLSPRFHLVTSTAHSKQHSTHLPNKRQNWRHMCWWLEWNCRLLTFIFTLRLRLPMALSFVSFQHIDFDSLTSLWGRGSICNSYSFLVIFSFWSEGKTDQSSDMTEVITLSLHSCHI